ncbi:MAG: hypothetical protein OJF59_002404 [Cytophagales bacterium]|nr:hypothetical protein [Bacteroidota bacterium]MBS1980140.1 hypothetical protein [Bacteroidota bacterium]WHZ08650.1 MAG: hypothetical protein OJF59_002404 [Cytophagales bacterium]
MTRAFLSVITLIICSINLFAQKKDSAVVHRRVVQLPKNEPTGSAKRTRSKIVNDSAKLVYGPKTTLSTTEEDFFENKKNYVPLDTSIYNLHRWDFVKKFENTYQDLGNMGTAMNSVFPLVSDQIGATPGFKVYDVYWQTAEPRYYDTKSPFARINVIWGGKGRALTHVEFTRNIHKRWNFGFNYRPILSVKQIQPSGKTDYQVRSQYYDFYTTYESKNGKYKILAAYRRISHQVKENGGILLNRPGMTTVDTTYKAYFDANAVPNLTAAATSELRNSFHFFHQYQLAKPAQVYHIMDVYKQVNTFFDTRATDATSNFFPTTTVGTDTAIINDANTFQSFKNEIGFKGNAAFVFYDFYFRNRIYSNTMANLQAQASGAKGYENYIGSRIVFQFDSLSYLSGQAEFLLGGRYKIFAKLRTPWLDADLRSALAKPGLMQQAYLGGYNSWVNSFTNTFTNQLSGRIKTHFGPLFFSPGLSYTLLKNYIFFKSDALQLAQPMQSPGAQQVFSPELRLGIRFLNHFNFRPYGVYTKLLSNDNNAISIPTWFVNAQLSYENFLFNKALQVQIGVDVHANDKYYAYGYDPAVQQFYVQNKFANPTFWSTDVFLNGRIKRGRFFVKYVNLLQTFTKQGYLPTPLYPNVRNTIDFGFELILFD